MQQLKLSFLTLLLAVFLCGFSGVANANTSNKALWCPNVAPETDTELGALCISETEPGSINRGDYVTVTFPSYVELTRIKFYFPGGPSYLPSVTNATYPVDFSDAGFTVNGQTYSYGDKAGIAGVPAQLLFQATARNSFTLIVNQEWAPTTKYVRIYCYLDRVHIKPVRPEDLESSDIKVTLDAPSTAGFSSGSVTVGKLLTAGGSNITAAAATEITDIGGQIANITLKEDFAGALKPNAADFPSGNTVKLVLSLGFTWDRVQLIPQGGFGAGSVGYDVYTEKNGCSALYLKIDKASSGSPGQLVIKASVKANEPFATARDVKVTYGGTNPGVGGEKIAEVTVAKYLVSGLSAAAKSTLDVVAGRQNQHIGSFTVTEGMACDLPSGRLLSLTLPEGAKWNRLPTVAREAGNGQLEYHRTRDDGRTLIYRVSTESTRRTIFCFKNATVDLTVYLPEELTVTVRGPGLSQSVTVANVQAPVKVTPGGGKVRVGLAAQPVGAVTIQENVVGALRARDAAGNRAVLKLTLPAGVRFAAKPNAAVTAGDLELDTAGIKLEDDDRTLVIPVKLASATPVEKPVAGSEQVTTKETTHEETTAEAAYEQMGSTVVVDNILLTLDRTVPVGPVTLEVSGSALSETETLFSSSLNKLSCVLAECLTPAPVAIRAEAVFAIGSTRYRIGSEEKEMEVAPYIKNGRTYAPVRYLAYAAGIGDDQIIWDGANRTVTIFAGKRVVQFKLGAKDYLLNGVPVSIDAAPEIVSGRTMLPYRFVAQALGLKAEWDGAKRQVIIR
ncbi:copper amine oxidase N-terminal domain-containing protein [Thermodesulfitimonas sp.]